MENNFNPGALRPGTPLFRALLSFAGPGITECPDNLRPQPDTLPNAQSHTYKTASGRDLRLHLFGVRQGRRKPAIVFFFGGSWRLGTITAFAYQAHHFARAGYVTALADYRVFCRDQTTPFDAMTDAAAAYMWMRGHAAELGINRRRMVVAGGSAGGHLALMTALRARPGKEPAALVLFNPAVDLVTRVPKMLQPLSAKISPLHQPLGALPPTLIMHGEDDKIVALDDVRRFHEAARAAGRDCRLVTYPGLGHAFFHEKDRPGPGGLPPREDTLARAGEFLQEVLTPATAG